MNFHKLKIIFMREYITRVRGKGFIVATILIPVFIFLILVVPMLLSNVGDSATVETYVLVDETASVAPRMVASKPDRYMLRPGVPLDSLRQEVLEGELNGYILITEGIFDGSKNPEFYNLGSGGLALVREIRDDIRSAVREELFTRTSASEEVKAIFELRPELVARRLTAEGEEGVDAFSAFVLAYVMGFTIYFGMFGYGALVMQSVMEEKSSRIVDIIVSSARPMELLVGKVFGVVALSLTQIVIWFLSFTVITAAIMPMLITSAPADAGSALPAQAEMGIPEIGIGLWIFFAIFYMLGFMIYSGLFAAVGAAAESPHDATQLSLPIYIPILIPILLLMPVTSDPNSTMAVVTSLIPFFSPILMMARIVVTDVPLWQSLLSVLLMAATFVALMWLSGKIYRVGILMYGKKVNFREVARWLRY